MNGRYIRRLVGGIIAVLLGASAFAQQVQPVGLPVGGEVHATLLNGLDAPLVGPHAGDRWPLVLEVQSGGVGGSIAGCMVIAEGVASAAAERLTINTHSISCMAGAIPLQAPFDAIVTDTDDIAGIKGTVKRTDHGWFYLDVPQRRKAKLILKTMLQPDQWIFVGVPAVK